MHLIVIIILLLILTHLWFQQFLEDVQEEIVIWGSAYDEYLKLLQQFGKPKPIKMESASGVIWELKDNLFRKIILLNLEKESLIIFIRIKLFAGYQNIQVTKKAQYFQLSQMHKLIPKLSYACGGMSFTSDTWEKSLLLSLLLTKISTSELDFEEIKKDQMIEKLADLCQDGSKNNKCYQMLQDYHHCNSHARS